MEWLLKACLYATRNEQLDGQGEGISQITCLGLLRVNTRTTRQTLVGCKMESSSTTPVSILMGRLETTLTQHSLIPVKINLIWIRQTWAPWACAVYNNITVCFPYNKIPLRWHQCSQKRHRKYLNDRLYEHILRLTCRFFLIRWSFNGRRLKRHSVLPSVDRDNMKQNDRNNNTVWTIIFTMNSWSIRINKDAMLPWHQNVKMFFITIFLFVCLTISSIKAWINKWIQNQWIQKFMNYCIHW